MSFPVFGAKQKQPKREMDFSAAAPANTASVIGPTGVVVKVKSAAIAKDGTITARFTIADSKGIPLDRLGVSTAGPVTMALLAAYIPAGKTQWVTYTTTTLAATLNKNPSQVQAANDSGGTFTTNAIGDYTYTFKTKAPVTFDPTLTHGIGITASRSLVDYGTFDQLTQIGNDVFNFVPDGTPVKTTRAVVQTATCNNCHDPLSAHGGSRQSVDLCVMCHTPQTINPDTLYSMDMPVLVHKLHSGKNLPSVVAGGTYKIWHRGAWTDFTDVAYPQDTRNCTSCHVAGPAQADAWKTNPSRAACGACHDNVNFDTGENHVDLPVYSDTQCKACHAAVPTGDFDASIPGAHAVPNSSYMLSGLVAKLVSVKNATAGNAPVVTFTITDKAGKPVDISKITYVRVVLAGPNVDYQTGPGAMRVSENPATTPGTNGTYTYTMTNKIPAAATGSFTVSIEARNAVTLMAGTKKEKAAIDNALPVRTYFSVDNSPMVARRQVVSTEKCATCHQNLGFIHSGTRAEAQECTMCHNPTLVDSTLKQTVSFATQIHSIHRGENLANPYMLGTTNYQEVRFPGDLRNCSTCHVGTSYRVETVGAVAAIATPGHYTPTTLPIAAACQGCHDDKATASHALSNTNALGESCAVCHSQNGAFSVESVHAPKK